MAAPGPQPAIEIGELLERLDAGEPLLLLDVRNVEDAAAWPIEGRRRVEIVRAPYFEFLEDPAPVVARLRGDRPVVVVCAKGGSSEWVAGALREAGVRAHNLAGGMAAYGEHLEAVEVPGTGHPSLRLWQVIRRGKGCLSYVACVSGEAVVFDPSRRTEWYEGFVAGLGARIVHVLDTHVHADHLSGGPALAERARAAYSQGTSDERSTDRRRTLRDGDRLDFGRDGRTRAEIRVLASPGHTPEGACYLLDGRVLISGDTLFVHGVGRPDLGGKVEEWGRELFRTLHQRLGDLPHDTAVFPGHMSGIDEADASGVVRVSLGQLRASPEFLLGTQVDFVRALGASARPPPPAYASLVQANRGTIRPSEEQIAEWELGRNECASHAPGPRPGK